MSSDQSTLSSTTAQNMPVLPPYPGDEISTPPRPGSGGELSMDSFPPPPPPPKQQNALAALQRGGDLERRASRRYSAYQISKHLGASPNGLPMLPPAQNSPIPNRGRNDARESMRAVQNRGERHQRNASRLQTEMSPARIPSRISEEVTKPPVIVPPGEAGPDNSPIAKTPDDKLRQPVLELETPAPSATLQGPPSDALPMLPLPSKDSEAPEPPKPQQIVSTMRDSPPYPSQDRQFTPEESPPPNGQLTLFLQYKKKIKKFVLDDDNDLSIARLQLAFIEKFQWNTHNNGVDLPEIYIKHHASDVCYELEDLSDIKNGSTLVLHIDDLEEVKRHVDEGLGGIKKIIEGVRTAMDDQQVSLQRVSDRQQDTAKELTRMAGAPPASSRVSYVNNQRTNGALISPSKVSDQANLNEIQNIRRDMAVIRQLYSSFQSDMQNSMGSIRAKANSVKSVAITAAIPDVKGESGRAYVNAGKKAIAEDSDKLVGTVDDLQDVVEDLRKDVVTRGVRPLPRQLETVAKEISQATMEVKRMKDRMKHERPIWQKIWEKELETVCNDREELSMQEDLAADLQDDLEKAMQTFALVEQATKEQLKDAPAGSIAPRVLSRGLNHVTTADPAVAKEGVLGEVRALQPNHENRLEAIERAEKLRQKELESRRGGEFQKELGNFVEEGKLKKAGGFEEVERARKAKDERIRKEVWERQNGMTQADALAEAAEEPEAEEEAAGEGEAGDAPVADI